MTVTPLGDTAVVVTLGHTIDPAMANRVRALADELVQARLPGVVDVVPAFAQIGLFYAAGQAPRAADVQPAITRLLARVEARREAPEAGRRVEIPVCYGGGHGPDLAAVAERAGLSAAEVIARHSGADYLVHAIGFAPGFPYLGGLPPELATPRREAPRVRVPAGSVGIGGAQTGVYPLASPGGWNLIGRTPLPLFSPERSEPARLQAGDRVRFCPVESADFPVPPDAPGRPEIVRTQDPGIEVLRPGLQTTVQDGGRPGWRSRGVPLGGAADALAMRLVNLLVGNPEGCAGLEVALVGPELRFSHDSVVAVGGAEFDGVPAWRPLRISAGSTLRLGPVRRGCRGYVAVAGGIDVAPVLGSRSTLIRAGFGGWQGRALQAGDVLPVQAWRGPFSAHWHLDPRILPAYASEVSVRVLPGAEAGEFPAGALSAPFTVSRHSDRMGVRLEGPPLRRDGSRELWSAPVSPGTIQVPPGGQPIVLLADAQTLGGYPQVAHVASVDLPVVAQLQPGDRVRFREISGDEARELAAAREHALALLRQGLKEKWS